MIEDNLLSIVKCLFSNRKDWIYVTDEQKEEYFFIVNRFLSKKYPEKSQLLNIKSINKVSSMNIWFHFMKGEPYPTFFWSKSPKIEKELSDADFKLLFSKLGLNKREDLNFLINKYPDLIKEELKFYKTKK